MPHDRVCSLIGVLAGLILSAAAFGGGAGGGSIVYDPTNHVENATTALESVRQTANQVRAYATQLQQYRLEVEQWRRLPATVVDSALSPWRQERDAALRLAAELQATWNSLSTLQQGMGTRLREMAGLRMSPDDYLRHEVLLARKQGAGHVSAFAADVGALQAVNGHVQRLQALQDQIRAPAGLQQSLQTVNQHLNLLAGQNVQLINLIGSHQAAVSAQAGSAAGRDAAAADEARLRWQRESAAIDAMRREVRRSERATGWGLLH